MDHFVEHTSNPPTAFAVGMTTCDRKHSKLDESLESCREAGFGNVSVYNDSHPRLGAWRNFRDGLLSLVMAHPIAHAYIMLQDDILVSCGLRDYLKRTLWPGGYLGQLGVVSLYCARMFDDMKSTGYTLWQRGVTSNKTYGALGYVFTAYSARFFLATSPRGGLGEAGVDIQVGNWTVMNGLDYWIHMPSLLQHTGDTSTISDLGVEKSRRARRFCKDARLLLDASSPPSSASSTEAS